MIPLGAAIPRGHPHAVSVSLPEWRDIVGYEENEPRVLDAMQCGYPRFFLHHFVQELRARYQAVASAGESVWVFPSLRIADKCVAYVGAGRVQETVDGIAIALVPQDKDERAKEFWQHAGLVVSSRQAENILRKRRPADPAIRETLRQRVAGLYAADAGDVFLSTCGISAIFTAYEAVTRQRGTKTIQLGFPYLDTLKIQQKFGDGIYVPYTTPDDLAVVERLVRQGDIAAVFCEVPGNPLLKTIDLKRLQGILQPRGVPLIIDDTIGTPLDIDILPYADIVVTSLTKFFSGTGNAMGGSLVLNRASPLYATLKEFLRQGEEQLYPDDAAVLLDNNANFQTRMQAINRNAAQLAAFLRHHPAVARVNYTEGDTAYESIRRADGGYGGLLSFTLKDETRAPQVYDALDVAKGPSLGTSYTLVCPYTLLAHYHELDWAESCGISRNLLRVSVGTEDFDVIKGCFAAALEA